VVFDENYKLIVLENKNNSFMMLKYSLSNWYYSRVVRKNQFSQRTKKIKKIRIKIDIKNIFDWRVKLKRIITFTKESRKKIKIKIIRTKSKNIIPSIWIEW
jgi:hypothetical protein